jgi:molecular chaperone DnaK (HSP70)
VNALNYRLGIDFGTSNTVAAVYQPDGRTRPVLFDGFPLLPSSVCVSIDGGELLVGREAAHSARVHPERFEPYPKRRIDDGTVLLGTDEYPVAQLIAAVLGRVRAEVVRMMGGEPGSVVLTHPAAWGGRRRAVLLDAARRAGLEGPALLAEPVAAASYFVDVTEVDVAAGSCVVVYDFGAGTFDASVLRRTVDGWELLASDGLPDAGGLDVDAAIVAYISATYTSSRPEEVRRLVSPESAGDRRANRLLWDDVRTAKEVLSRTSSTYVHVPLIEDDVPLGREQLERLARPVLDRTVSLTRSVIRSVVPDGTLAGVFLVGGSSRIPLAATLLHRAVQVSPTAIEQPELVVAEGSARDHNHATMRPPDVDGTGAHRRPGGRSVRLVAARPGRAGSG